jgi:hypothetical protein
MRSGLARRRRVIALATILLVSPPTCDFSLEPLLAQSLVVTVSGDVKRPGEYRLEDGLTVRAAIEAAGGLDGEAVRQISIVRQTGDRGALVFAAATDATVLVAGDQVAVTAHKLDFIVPSAQRVVGWMSAGQFDSVIVAYRGTVRGAAFEEQLRSQWQGLQKQLGTFQRQLGVRAELLRGTDRVGVVTCQFAGGRAEIVVVFNRNGGIIDVSMAPSVR